MSSCSSLTLANFFLCYANSSLFWSHSALHLFLKAAMLSMRKALSYLSDSLLMYDSCVIFPLKICKSFSMSSVYARIPEIISLRRSMWLPTGRFIPTSCFSLPSIENNITLKSSIYLYPMLTRTKTITLGLKAISKRFMLPRR